jgi:atypical dual specificity phosphatase
VIEIRELTTFFGEKLIHACLSLDISEGKIHVLMGPSGGGKSSLMKIVAKFASLPQPGVTSGQVMVDGQSDYGAELFFVVLQKIDMFSRTGLDLLVESIPEGGRYTRSEKEDIARNFVVDQGIPLSSELIARNYTLLPYAKKNVLLCAMAMLSDRRYVFLDEPTAKVNDHEAVEILEMIRKLKQVGKTVVCVLHNQKHAKLIGDEIHLLAGGRIIESTATTSFFSAPLTVVTKTFVETGSCSVPAPDTPAAELSDVGRLYKQIFSSSKPTPTGFHWLIADKLAGCMRPGLLCAEEDDLRRLQRLGISHLVSLEEEVYVPEDNLAQFSIAAIHFPIDDMKAPTDEAALYQLLGQLHQLLLSGKKVVVHCKAGLGRTGTVLACYAAFADPALASPLEFIRRVNPRWVQSEAQENFVLAFRHYLSSLTNYNPVINRR